MLNRKRPIYWPASKLECVSVDNGTGRQSSPMIDILKRWLSDSEVKDIPCASLAGSSNCVEPMAWPMQVVFILCAKALDLVLLLIPGLLYYL